MHHLRFRSSQKSATFDREQGSALEDFKRERNEPWKGGSGDESASKSSKIINAVPQTEALTKEREVKRIREMETEISKVPKGWLVTISAL
jgi:hypothetical protein